MRSIRPRSSSVAERQRRALVSLAALELVEVAEGDLEQVRVGAEVGLRVGLRLEERLDLNPSPLERRAPGVVEGGSGALDGALFEQLGETRPPASDVARRAGWSPRRAARGRARSSASWTSDPSQSGSASGSSRCGESSCSTNHLYGQVTHPSSELALNAVRDPSSESTAGAVSGPGRRFGSERPANSASIAGASADRPSRSSTDSRSPAQPPSASARASPRSVVASSGASTARSGPRLRTRRQIGVARAGRDQVEYLVDERRAGERGAVLVVALPAQVQPLGRPRDAGVKQVALLLDRIGAAQVAIADLAAALLGEQRVRRRGARETRRPEARREQRPGAGGAGPIGAHDPHPARRRPAPERHRGRLERLDRGREVGLLAARAARRRRRAPAAAPRRQRRPEARAPRTALRPPRRGRARAAPGDGAPPRRARGRAGQRAQPSRRVCRLAQAAEVPRRALPGSVAAETVCASPRRIGAVRQSR